VNKSKELILKKTIKIERYDNLRFIYDTGSYIYNEEGFKTKNKLDIISNKTKLPFIKTINDEFPDKNQYNVIENRMIEFSPKNEGEEVTIYVIHNQDCTILKISNMNKS
jgi:hypothetical protein